MQQSLSSSLPFVRPLAGCRNTIVGILLGFVLIGVGAAIFIWSGETFRWAMDSPNWPTVQGEVMRSEVRQSRDSDGDTMYSADIEYTYTVGGTSYTSTMISLADGSTSMRGAVQRTVTDHPAGSSVTVYYLPDDPSVGVLKPGLTGGVWMFASMILCFPAAGLLALFGTIAQIFRIPFLRNA